MLRESEREVLFEQISPKRALIIGGGISGLVLARSMAEAGWKVKVAEKVTGPEEMVPKWYLVCKRTAEVFRIEEEWEKRREEGVITGFTTYSYPLSGREPRIIDCVDHNWAGEEYGFVVFDQRELIGRLLTDVQKAGGRICFGEEVKLRKGGKKENEELERSLVVNSAGIMNGEEGCIFDNESRGRAIYGCNVAGRFDPNQLLFLFDESNGKAQPRRPSAWLMPYSRTRAQVVISEDVPLVRIQEWLDDPGLEEKLEYALRVFIRANRCTIGGGRELFKSFFRTSTGTLSEARRWERFGQIPFGEVIGMNTPAIGELIDRIGEAARRWTLLLEMMPDGKWPDYIGDWLYYTWREISSPLMLAAMTKTKRKWSERGLVDPVGTVLMKSVPKDRLWAMARGSYRPSIQVMKELVFSPSCYGFMAQAVIAWIPIFLRDVIDRRNFEKRMCLAS